MMFTPLQLSFWKENKVFLIYTECGEWKRETSYYSGNYSIKTRSIHKPVICYANSVEHTEHSCHSKNQEHC